MIDLIHCHCKQHDLSGLIPKLKTCMKVMLFSLSFCFSATCVLNVSCVARQKAMDEKIPGNIMLDFIYLFNRRRKLEEVAKYEMLMEHKNVVKFYRAWEEDRMLYIQMELCELR